MGGVVTHFFSRETSRKLAEIGCKSESGIFYDREERQPCFHFYDLLGGSETAIENCRKVLKDDGKCFECDELATHPNHEGFDICEVSCRFIEKYWGFRHALLDLPDDDKESYILRTLTSKGE